jgi:hypothetical protein
MALSATKKVSVNGWINLYTQAKADGYQGSPIVRSGTILNQNATVAYVHVTANGATNPATGADGLPIGTASAPSAAFNLDKGTDLAGVWIFTSGAQDIKYEVIGS